MKGINILFALIIFLFGCNRTPSTESEYLKWLADPDHGITQSKTINGTIITVKYIPDEYLVYKELKRMSGIGNIGKIRDSLRSKYIHSRTFLLTIAPDVDKKNESDIMYSEVGNYQDYKDRFHSINFNMEENLLLKTEKNSFAPVLAIAENIYSVGNQRTINLVFADNEIASGLMESEELDFEFNDPFFHTGVTHFHFKKSVLENTPEINFVK